ncbi:hypothetical protein SynA1544_01865 [Synechococcus sp. A15-44]|nr:hypothetical protein SynA1544_01865 [Synechococcus sp. A15-44]
MNFWEALQKKPPSHPCSSRLSKKLHGSSTAIQKNDSWSSFFDNYSGHQLTPESHLVTSPFCADHNKVTQAYQCKAGEKS